MLEDRSAAPSTEPSPPFVSKDPIYGLAAPCQTEVAYLLDNGQTEGIRVYIVAFAIDKIKYKPSKLKFLSGLGYAIYVAAFVLEEDEEDATHGRGDGKELDEKELFAPRPLGTSMVNLSGLLELSMPVPSAKGIWSPKPSRTALAPSIENQDDDVGLSIDTLAMESPGKVGTEMIRPNKIFAESSFVRPQSAPITSVFTLTSTSSPRPHSSSPSNANRASGKQGNTVVGADNASSFPPTWEPVDTFSFPIANIPIKCFVPDNLTFNSFEEMKHIADGSNANIFLGKFLGLKVVVKMIKEDVQSNPVAVHEFDVEHGMLSRFSHPHIIRLLGAGMMPRRFIVIEYLGGGSLATVLENNKEKPGLAQRFFRKPTFTYATLLMRARDMADALNYLHSQVHEGAIVIHRDLKPDNVGFTANGTLKLFDFGLCTCVKAHEQAAEVYEMTGNTGSLRYMAPEVALRRSYNERVDVYSFGIMVWQMARDRVPFKGLSKIEFFNTVVNGDNRPPLDKAWPNRFSQLLTSCWHSDYLARPSFAQLVEELDSLYVEARGKPSTPPTTPPLANKSPGINEDTSKPGTPGLSKQNSLNDSKDRKHSWF